MNNNRNLIQFNNPSSPSHHLQQSYFLGQPCHLSSTLDEHDSTCGPNLYCSAYTLICLPQRDIGSPCRSSIQCLSGSCEHSMCVASSRQKLVLSKRDHGQNFSTVHDHSTAFNVIHLIIVIVGIAVASIVGILAFVLFRKRRKASNEHEKAATLSTLRFAAFQQAFFNSSCADDIRPAEEVRLRTSDQTPLMQQQQLQWQLLEQQRRKAPPPSPSSLPYQQQQQPQQDIIAPPPPPYQP